jgi:hypothetical protein
MAVSCYVNLAFIADGAGSVKGGAPVANA